MTVTALSRPAPCADAALRSGRSWGTVRTRVAARIDAYRDDVMDLFLDYDQWPRIFAETIRGVELAYRGSSTIAVKVDHRKEGRVLNVLTICRPDIVMLQEHKSRYDALFVNRFDHALGGMRYSIDAEVHFKQPLSLIAPFLTGVVERALRRYTLHPVRIAAERL